MKAEFAQRWLALELKDEAIRWPQLFNEISEEGGRTLDSAELRPVSLTSALN